MTALRQCEATRPCVARPILLVSPPPGVAGVPVATCGTHGTNVIRRMIPEWGGAVVVRAIGGEVIASYDEPIPGDHPIGGDPGDSH